MYLHCSSSLSHFFFQCTKCTKVNVQYNAIKCESKILCKLLKCTISTLYHRIEINRKATRVGTFEVCVSTHVSLRMLIMLVLASQLPFLANRNAELAVPPLFWPDKCIKIGGHVALLSGPTVYTLIPYTVTLPRNVNTKIRTDTYLSSIFQVNTVKYPV